MSGETGNICRRTATVSFWDGYAPWYRLWIEHSCYHNRITEVLTDMAEPGWKVLDIGAGSGVLSLPLCAIGCEVTALEPSTAMRSLLFEETFRRGIDWLKVDDRRWEDIHPSEFHGYDLALACNSLHLNEFGFDGALEKLFNTGARHILLVTERFPELRIRWSYPPYDMLFAKWREVESSFAYHAIDEACEHWAFKLGRDLLDDEKDKVCASLTFEDGHFWDKDTALVGMFWWKRALNPDGNRTSSPFRD